MVPFTQCGSYCESEKKQEKLSAAHFEMLIIHLFKSFYMFEDVYNKYITFMSFVLKAQYYL